MIQWIAFILSFAGILLNAKKNMWCWPIWIVSNILWIIFNLSQPTPDYATLCLWMIFMMSNIYGWFQWGKDSYEKNKDSALCDPKNQSTMGCEDDYEPIGWQKHLTDKDGY